MYIVQTSVLLNSTSGYEELPASILKQCTDSYIESFTCLINLLISQGTFPIQLKLARVIPFFKGEDEQLVQNYRPISVLPFFQKLLKRLQSLMLVISLTIIISSINTNQFGFRKGHSTRRAIITLFERVLQLLIWENMQWECSQT